MVGVRRSPPPPLPAEQRVLVHGVLWRNYVVVREALDKASLRLTYCEGSLEITSSSRQHEFWKKSIARLVELVAYERRLPLIGYGSTTFREEAKERGAEPDECYRVGSQMRDGEFPDIALEVIHSSPLLDKLQVYAGFEVPEVWLFERGHFRLFGFRGGTYVPLKRSALLPQLDFGLIARFALREDQDVALLELSALLRKPPQRKARRSKKR